MPMNYQGTEIEHATIFDLVGWIFSISGTSPAGATRSNYYYPLIALYCMFVRRLCPNPRLPGDAMGEPQMVQATWFKQGTVIRVAIGATLDKPGSGPKEGARIQRATRMVDIGWLRPQDRDTLTYVPAPTALPNQPSLPQLFGHCAESLPLIYIQS